jgi:hypothetical protein
MIKGKQGSIFLGVAIGLFMFVSGILILPYLTDSVATFRVALNCADVGGTLSSGTKLACLFGGSLIPFYLWFLTALCLGLILGGGRQ